MSELGGIGLVWGTTIVLTTLSIVMSGLILYVYYRGLRVSISRLTLGLFMFALFMLVESVVSLYQYVSLSTRFGPEVGYPALSISLAGVVALGFLLWATWQ